MRIIFSTFLCALFASTLAQVESTSLNKDLNFEGRLGKSAAGNPVFYWAGSSASIQFMGTSIGVTLDDSKGENFFQVIIDGHDEFPIVIDCDKGKNYYHIAAGLPKGKHIAKLVKRTEPWEGSTVFDGFKVDGKVLPMEKPGSDQLKIEFYGNSITSGMGNEDLSSDGSQNGPAKNKNHYLSYASLTSRKLNAEHRCISLSGIGIMVSWGEYIMPEIYNRIDPFDENSAWDFTLWTPDIVVVNLFQNDSWIVELPENGQFKKRFVKGVKPSEEEIIGAHYDFIRSIRKEYPDASIICALGSMDATKKGSAWPGYVSESIERMKQDGDSNVYQIVFPHNGHKGHPTVFHDFEMSDQLVGFIKDNSLNTK